MYVEDITIVPESQAEINGMLLAFRRYDRRVGDFPLEEENRRGNYFFAVRSAIKKLRNAKPGKPLTLTYEQYDLLQDIVSSQWTSNTALPGILDQPSSREAKYLEGPTDTLLIPKGRYEDFG